MNRVDRARHRAASLGLTLEAYQEHTDAGERWCSLCRKFEPQSAFFAWRHSPDGLSYICRESRRRYGADHYRRHRERIIRQVCAYGHAKYWADPERARLRSRENQRKRRAHDLGLAAREAQRWRRANPDKARRSARESTARWRRRDPEASRAAYRRWAHSAHGREMLRSYGKRYYQAHRAEALLRATLRRVRGRHIPGVFSGPDLEGLFIEQGGRCFYCAADLTLGKPDLDHKTPISRGGTNDPDNLCWACSRCNRRKHTRTAEEFARWLAEKEAA